MPSFRDRYLESIVGGFLLSCGVAAAMAIAYVAWFSGLVTPTHRYLLELDDGVGLGPGARVTIAGMRVGAVEDVVLTDDRRVLLALAVESKYAEHVKEDSIGAAAMTLSGKVVRIEAGSPSAPMLADGGHLVGGNNFDVLRALENMDLVHNIERIEKILIELNELASQMHLGDGLIPKAVDDMLLLIGDMQAGKGTVGRLLKEDAALTDITGAIEAVEKMAGAVEGAAAQLGTTSGEVTTASRSIVVGAEAIGGASEALARTAVSVDASASKLATSLERLDAGLVELEKTMRAIQGLPLIRKQVDKQDGAD